jgi:hypothetical protein
MIPMVVMTDPKPTGPFEWTQEPWGRALRCTQLPVPHLFTSRDVMLRQRVVAPAPHLAASRPGARERAAIVDDHAHRARHLRDPRVMHLHAAPERERRALLRRHRHRPHAFDDPVAQPTAAVEKPVPRLDHAVARSPARLATERAHPARDDDELELLHAARC